MGSGLRYSYKFIEIFNDNKMQNVQSVHDIIMFELVP